MLVGELGRHIGEPHGLRAAAGGGAWQKVADVAAGSTARTVDVLDSGPTAGARYYRLVTPAQ